MGHDLTINSFFRLISENNSYHFVNTENGLATVDQSHKPHRADNRAMWALFQEALQGQFSEARIDKVCKKYHLSFETAQNRPLRVKDVAKFYLSLHQITSADIKERLEHLKERSIEEIAEAIHALRPASIDYEFPYVELTTFYNPMTREQGKYCLLKDLDTLDLDAWMERVTKTLSTMELDYKQILPIPHEGEIEYYKVYAKISRKGLTAYALKPLHPDCGLPPLLVFRPTMCAFSDEGMIDNWIDNFLWDYGLLGYTAASTQLNALIKDEKFCDATKKAQVSGYSLGGNHAQYFIAEHFLRNSDPQKISLLTSYNAPGVRDRVARVFAAYVNKSENPLGLEFKIYRTEGDPLQKLGGPHLGSGVTRSENLPISIDRAIWHENLSPDERHQKRRFDRPELEPGPIEVEDYNNSTEDGLNHCETFLRRRRVDTDWTERLRPIAGIIVRIALTIFQILVQCFAFITRTTIIRHGTSYGPARVIRPSA